MIHLFRNQKFQKRVYLFLAVTVILSFGVSGLLISHSDQQSGGASVGQIHDKSIKISDYLASYKAVQHQAMMMYGEGFNRLRPLLNLKGQAWDRLLLLDYAKRQNLKVADEEVVAWISKQPFFYSQNQFNDRAYRLFLTQYLRIEPRQFEEEIRQMLLIGKLEDTLASKIKITDNELTELYAQQKGARDLAYGLLAWETEKNNASVTEEELKQLYPLFQDRLRSPDQVSIEYLAVAEDAPESAKTALKETSSIDSISTKYGLPLQKTGLFSKIENIPGLGLLPEVLAAAFSTPEGKESDWIVSGKTSYKLRVTERKTGAPLDFDSGKDDLKQVILKDKASQLAAKKLNDLKSKTKPEDFSSALTAAGIEVQTLKNFKAGDYLPGIGPSENIERMIASLKAGEVSGAIPVRSGAAIFKVTADASVNQAQFAKEKEDFRKEALLQKSEEALEKLLKDLRNSLKLNQEVLNQIFPPDSEK